MDYFRIFNFNKEPFSNSPDPEFFFQSRQHVKCLQKIELAIRLRRGLNVVIGDVGTGKTTLCRQLIRRFAGEGEAETHLMLDPYFSSSLEFLSTVAGMFGAFKPETGASEWQLRESIKKYLFSRGVDEKKTVILIIDEGQKIPDFCLEILREFLNYEVNEYKLLQIVIFAQKEFEQGLKKCPNFADRINICFFLGSLNFRETRLMIQFRLNRASAGKKTPAVFSYPALWAVYLTTGGYPRKIINLCHQIILTLIIQNRTRAGWSLVRSCVKRVSPEQPRRWQRAGAAVLIGLVAVALLLGPVLGRLKIRETSSRLEVTIAQNSPVPFGAHEAGLEAAHEASPEVSSQSNNFPEVLGQVTVKPGETALEMIYKLYGAPIPDHLSQILAFVVRLNPQIKDLDAIYVGDVINFPAVPAPANSLPSKAWWVQVANKETLEEAYEFVRVYADPALPLRMLPYWNSREGMKFAVLVRYCFVNEKSARACLSGLPAIAAAGAKIVTKWDKDTVFFANVPKGIGRPLDYSTK